MSNLGIIVFGFRDLTYKNTKGVFILFKKYYDYFDKQP